MPIYEYRCPNGHAREVIDLSYRHADISSVVCFECHEPAGKVFANSNWQINHDGPKESNISRAIGRVKKAEREGKIP